MTALLWALLWQTLVVAGAAAVGAWLLRRGPAAARHGVFLGALLVSALLPAAGAWMHLTLARAPASATVVVLARQSATSSGVAAGTRDRAPLHRPDLDLVLGFLWGGVMLLQAGGLARRARRARRAVRGAALERVVDGVPVLRGEGGPFTVGWLRPRIVLPAALLEREAWSRAALAHELEHVRRRDYLWAWLGELALLPLAWHPAARWLEGRAALAREAACDEAARAADATYPTHLVDIAAALHLAAASHAGQALARCQGFEQRIAWLTAAAPPRSRVRMTVAGAVLSVAVTAAWALGGGVRRGPAPAPHTGPTQAGPAFDAASVRPAPARGSFRQRGEWGFGSRNVTPGGLHVPAATLDNIFAFAYDVKIATQVTGLTGWMQTERWSIEARAPAGTPDLTANIALARRMTQRLLADRFNLKLTTETRVLPVYELRLAGSAPKRVTAAKDTSQAHELFLDGRGVYAEAVTMADLARTLSGPLGRVIIDHTGLTGTYKFKVNTPEVPNGAPMSDLAAMQFRDLIGALGLKLVDAKAPIKVYAVITADRPQPN
ncbi:MAG: TIGR03435 family protein [Terriglobales bacterium]